MERIGILWFSLLLPRTSRHNHAWILWTSQGHLKGTIYHIGWLHQWFCCWGIEAIGQSKALWWAQEFWKLLREQQEKYRLALFHKYWNWITTSPHQHLRGDSNGRYNGLDLSLTLLNFTHEMSPIIYINIHTCMNYILMLLTHYDLHTMRWSTTFHRNTYLGCFSILRVSLCIK